MEWRPSFVKGVVNDVAVLQLAAHDDVAGHTALVLHLAHMSAEECRALPDGALGAALRSPTLRKAGVGLLEDCCKLSAWGAKRGAPFEVMQRIEVGDAAVGCGLMPRGAPPSPADPATNPSPPNTL